MTRTGDGSVVASPTLVRFDVELAPRVDDRIPRMDGLHASVFCLEPSRTRVRGSRVRHPMSHQTRTVVCVFDYTVTCSECGASWWYSDERGPDELDTVECLQCGATTQDIRLRGKRHFDP